MKRILLLIVPFILVACSAAATVPTATQTPTITATNTLSAFSETKLFQLTAEMLTITASQPKNDATITAIMANKYALGTSMAGTMTAMPTFTLTPTIPPGSPACRAQDLQPAFSGTMGATQSIVIGWNLTNISASPCFLQTWPQAVLVDSSGNPLDIQYTYSGPSSLPYDPNAMLGLPPGRMAAFSFQWGNWCMPALNTGASVRLILARNGGTLTIPTDITAGGVCNDAGSRSWVGIFPFSLP